MNLLRLNKKTNPVLKVDGSKEQNIDFFKKKSLYIWSDFFLKDLNSRAFAQHPAFR